MKIFKYLFFALLIMLAGMTYAYANVARLVLIDYSDFNKVTDNMYLSGHLPDDSKQKIHSLLVDAKTRIAKHYGEINAKPKIIALSGKEELKNYGLNSNPGMLLFTPWDSYLLLNFQKANIDVTAHELVHAEIVHRVGYLKRQLHVPTWFDEGAAMQVDYRNKYDSPFSIEKNTFNELIKLKSPKQFWTDNSEQNVEHYRHSKSAVTELFKHSDDDLYTLLDNIKQGNTGLIDSLANKTKQTLRWSNN